MGKVVLRFKVATVILGLLPEKAGLLVKLIW
jgi:hypothetical protein